MNDVYLLVGGNIGDRKRFLSEAMQAIDARCGPVYVRSSLYETAAWGREDQPAFLNQLLRVGTPMEATELLAAILRIEESLGRKRDVKYGPRTIDIDILFFNDEVINLPGLTIPHPQMPYRRFVLEPLNEIAADKIHPVLHQSVSQMLAACTDPLAVNKIN